MASDCNGVEDEGPKPDNVWTFDDLGNLPLLWKDQALNLLMAAKVLREADEKAEITIDGKKEKGPPLRSFWVRISIRAFAVENLVKACLLQKGHRLYNNGRFCGPRDHTLAPIFEQAGFAMSSEERNLLDRLSAVALSVGRYPFPVREDQFDSFTPGRSGDFRIEWVTPHDEVLFAAILRRLMEKLEFSEFEIDFYRDA